MTTFVQTKNVLDVEIGHINHANIEQLKTINTNTLPVRYSPKFYKDLLAPEGTTEYIYDPKFLKFAHYQGFTVGAVCARMEVDDKQEGKYRLYIMIMNVLAAYRRKGIATKLLEYVVEEAAKDDRISELVLHVQTSNLEAKEFYIANGFVEVEIVQDYYKRIDPTSAFLLKKQNIIATKIDSVRDGSTESSK